MTPPTLWQRLRLVLLILLAQRTRDWRGLARRLDAYATDSAYRSLLAAIRASEALEAERRQVLAGTRVTREAAGCLREAERILRIK